MSVKDRPEYSPCNEVNLDLIVGRLAESRITMSQIALECLRGEKSTQRLRTLLAGLAEATRKVEELKAYLEKTGAPEEIGGSLQIVDMRGIDVWINYPIRNLKLGISDAVQEVLLALLDQHGSGQGLIVEIRENPFKSHDLIGKYMSVCLRMNFYPRFTEGFKERFARTYNYNIHLGTDLENREGWYMVHMVNISYIEQGY